MSDDRLAGAFHLLFENYRPIELCLRDPGMTKSEGGMTISTEVTTNTTPLIR